MLVQLRCSVRIAARAYHLLDIRMSLQTPSLQPTSTLADHWVHKREKQNTLVSINPIAICGFALLQSLEVSPTCQTHFALIR